MDAKRKLTLLSQWSLALIPLLGGCVHNIAPVLQADIAQITVRDRWPLRVALVYPDEDRRKNHSFSYSIPGGTYNVELPLGSGLEAVLTKSLPQIFDSVNVTRVQPPSGAYELVLIPKLGSARLEVVGGKKAQSLRLAVQGSLRVVDATGAQIATWNVDSEESERRSPGPLGTTEQTGRLASRVLTNLVKRWGDELVVSREVQDHAMRLHPELAMRRMAPPAFATSSTGSRPTDGELSVSIAYPGVDSRISQPSVFLVATIRGTAAITGVDVSVNGQPVPLGQRVEGTATVMPLSQPVPLNPGENIIVVTARDRAGGLGQKVVRVFRESREAESRTIQASSGSGFLLRNTNLILTNYHVVKEKSRLIVKFPNGEEYQGQVTFRDSGNDLALVEAKGLRPTARGLVIAVSAEARIGETIHALGYPLGTGLSRSPSMVSGAISSTVGVDDDVARFRTTAPINPGNSGGPIVNQKGQVIGIAVAGLVREGVEAIRFGIKASTATLILQQAQVTTSFDIAVTPSSPRSPDEIFSQLSPHVVLIEGR